MPWKLLEGSRALHLFALTMTLLTTVHAQSAESPRGSLVIMGGGERLDNRDIWPELIRLSGGKGCKLAIIPTATYKPKQDSDEMVAHFRAYGAEPFIVPLAFEDFEERPTNVANDPVWCEKVRSAGGVYFIGGEQGKIRDALLTKEGKRTPLLETLHELYQAGGCIAGSSAGAAIMSRIMYRDAESIFETLASGVTFGREIDYGLGFLPDAWFVDQHCLMRGRFGRALVAMQKHDFKFGLGIEEDTAVVIEGGRQAKVVGYKGIALIDLAQATSEPGENRFNLKNIRLHYLGHGDTIDLITRKVKVASYKLDSRKVDPFAKGFEPNYLRPIFFSDILADMMLVDTLYKLLDSPHNDAYGLAFDPAAARRAPSPGFEFHFRRQKDSVGWESEYRGPDEYTVLNIYLDIRPVTIQGPLYK
jgi:cyanophycinase